MAARDLPRLFVARLLLSAHGTLQSTGILFLLLLLLFVSFCCSQSASFEAIHKDVYHSKDQFSVTQL